LLWNCAVFKFLQVDIKNRLLLWRGQLVELCAAYPAAVLWQLPVWRAVLKHISYMGLMLCLILHIGRCSQNSCGDAKAFLQIYTNLAQVGLPDPIDRNPWEGQLATSGERQHARH
jgi:hypothetical protein